MPQGKGSTDMWGVDRLVIYRKRKMVDVYVTLVYIAFPRSREWISC
jgi:hypothetical protein